MTKYLISNNLLFSTNEKKIEIISKNSQIEIKDINYLENNINIIEKLNNILINKNEILIFSQIDNFSLIKEKIEKLYKTKKSKFKKIKEGDYEFIEKTSQIEILSQILEKQENNEEFVNLNLIIKEYSKTAIEKEEKILNNLNLEGEKLEIIINKIKKSIKKIDEQIKKIEKKKSELVIKKIKIEKEKLKLEKLLLDNKRKEQVEIEMKNINKKIDENKFKIEESKIDIKLLKAKITSLTSQILAGNKKHINPISYVLTLGLIHWTKFSDNKYIRIKLVNKINYINEKELEFEKKNHQLKKEINDKEIILKEILKEDFKKHEKIIIEIEKQDEFEKKLIKKEKEINLEIIKQQNEKDKIQINYEENINELNLIKEEKEKLKKNSIKNINKILESINFQRGNSILKLKNTFEKIKKQKINIEGDFVLEISGERFENRDKNW